MTTQTALEMILNEFNITLSPDTVRKFSVEVRVVVIDANETGFRGLVVAIGFHIVALFGLVGAVFKLLPRMCFDEDLHKLKVGD